MRRRELAVLGGFAACTAFAACTERFPREETRPDAAAAPPAIDASPDATSTVPPPGCLTPAPTGWIGPSAVFDGPPAAAPNACPPDYLRREVEARHVDGAPSTCGCADDPEILANCAVDVLTWDGTDASCSAGAETSHVVSSGCGRPIAVNTAPTFVTVKAVYDASGCYAKYTGAVTPAVVTATIACGREAPEPCAANASYVAAPVPPDPFTKLCVHTEGDVPCPSTAYPLRTLRHRQVRDERRCPANCSATVATTCAGAGFVTTDACTPATTPIPIGECTPVPAGTKWIAAVEPAVGQCGAIPKTSAPIGSIVTEDPITFCCTP